MFKAASKFRTLSLALLGAALVSGCGSRTPLNLVPSGEGPDDDPSGDRDAAVGGDVARDGRVDLDAPRDRSDAADARDGADVRDALDATDVSDTSDAPCFAVSREGKGIPIDFVFLVDKSTSMNADAGMKSRWTAMAGALNTFVQSPSSAGLGAAVAFFPKSTPGGNGRDCPVLSTAT